MSVLDLWLPILLVGLATHVMSTLAWMVLPHHEPEWRKLPNEDELQDLTKDVPAGQYLFPFAESPADMQGEEFKSKQGKCNGMLVLWGAPVSMGRAIGFTLAYFFVTAFCLGYLGSVALVPGEGFFDVFRFVTTAAILTHCFGMFPGVFWFRRQIAMDLLDKVAYAIVTGLLFAALWPAAA